VEKEAPFRAMKVAVVRPDLSIEEIADINPQYDYYEKNWAPFTVRSDPDHFYFVYFADFASHGNRPLILIIQ